VKIKGREIKTSNNIFEGALQAYKVPHCTGYEALVQCRRQESLDLYLDPYCFVAGVRAHCSAAYG